MRDFHLPGRSAVYATGAMAATSMPAATLTALDVLRAGGNALDAAVAAVAVLGVIEPQSTGIGGDCFCLYAPAGTGEVIAMNGSGRAAAAASIDWYEDRQIRAVENTSAHTVTIPGAVGAWETLLAAHGRKGLDEVLQPAIRFAAQGWPVHPKVAFDWKLNEAKLRRNGAHAFLPNGSAPQSGRLVRAARIGGNAARHRQAQGARAFYEGPVAADMVAALQSRGGVQTEADFAAGLKGARVRQPDPRLVEWLRGLPVPAQRLGPVGADVARHPGGHGRRAGRTPRRHAHAPPYRGGAAGVSRPRRLPGRSRAGRRSGGQADRRRLPRRPARADPRRPGDRRTAGTRRVAAAQAQRHGLSLRGGPRRQRVLVHQLAVPVVRVRHPGRAVRRDAAKPRLRLPLAARPPQLHRAGQAADAHHHPRDADAEDRRRAGGRDAVRRDGRAFPADGPDLVPDQFPALRAGHPGGPRPAAPVPRRRQGRGGARRAGFRCRRTGTPGPRHRRHRSVRMAAARRSGSIARAAA